MQRIKDAKPDALFIFMPIGELSIGSLRAVNDSGLQAQPGVKIIGTGDITDETYVDAVGDAALGYHHHRYLFDPARQFADEQGIRQGLHRTERQVAAHRLESTYRSGTPCN